MTIALVDDSSKDISLLYEYVCRYCNEHKLHMSIKQFTHEKSFFNTLKTEKYDLVFLDIFMQEQNGMLIAKEVKKYNPKCQIIFSTSSKDHAVKAFRLHALDYLLKPYTYARLEDSLNRFENTAARFAHYIELKEGRCQTRILVTDIMYVDYHNHYIQVHTNSRVIRSYMSFGEFLRCCPPTGSFCGVTGTAWSIWITWTPGKIMISFSRTENVCPFLNPIEERFFRHTLTISLIM